MASAMTHHPTPERPTDHSDSVVKVAFESIGVQRIAEADQTSTPWTFFNILVGGNLALGVVVFGWISITLGLGTVDALTSIASGVVLGIPLVWVLVVIGSRTATNNSTASGAHFGVRGRLVGSIVGLAISLAYTAIAIWSGGDATVAVLHRIFGTPTGNAAHAVAYTALILAIGLVAIVGFHLLARVERWMVALGAVSLALMVVGFVTQVHWSYRGGDYLLGDRLSTWVLSTVVVGVSGPLSMVTILGDWSRYVSPVRYPARRMLPVASLGLLLSIAGPAAIGVLLSTAFADPFADFGTSLATQSPMWLAVALTPFVTVGTVGFGATSMYSCGLDLDAIVPSLSRAGATALVCGGTIALVFVGAFALDAKDSIAAMSLVLVVLATPWAAVTSVGFLRARGRYQLDDLQVFNQGGRGGAYWFTAGFNLRAVLAWLAGAGFGCLAIDSSLYTGPLAGLAGGIDVSFLGSAVLSVVVYAACLAIWPERSAEAVLAPTAVKAERAAA
ncbi:MAG: purine-cytosine permease family protein [Actinomycetales bacterium]